MCQQFESCVDYKCSFFNEMAVLCLLDLSSLVIIHLYKTHSNLIADESDVPPPIPSRSNSSASRPPKAPRDRSIDLPEL